MHHNWTKYGCIELCAQKVPGKECSSWIRYAYFIPRTECTHSGVLMVSVTVVMWSCCSICSAAFFLSIFALYESFVWHVHAHFDCAGSHKRYVPIVGHGVFPANSCVTWLLCHVHAPFDCTGLHKVRVVMVSRACSLYFFADSSFFDLSMPTTAQPCTNCGGSW